MKQITASQKIAILENRVAQLEKQAIFGLFKSKEEKERARVIKRLQREISRETDVTKLEDLKNQIEYLEYDPDYAEYEETFKDMLEDIEASITLQKAKIRIRKMMEAESFKEFQKIIYDKKYNWEGDYSSSGLLEKQEELFLKYLLEPHDKNFKLNVASRADGYKKGFVTIKGHKYRIKYGRDVQSSTHKWSLTINDEVLYNDYISLNSPSMQFFEGRMKAILKSEEKKRKRLLDRL